MPSKSLNSFRQIDACVDGNILRRAITRKVLESGLSSKHTLQAEDSRPCGDRVAPEPLNLDFTDIVRSKANCTYLYGPFMGYGITIQAMYIFYNAYVYAILSCRML